MTAAGLAPQDLYDALIADAGGPVAGASVGESADAPRLSGVSQARAVAVQAAWTGARLHAGEPGLLAAEDPDVALLVGDWCFAHALGAVAAAGDLQAIALLSAAIQRGATGPSATPAAGPELAEIWGEVARKMACSG